MIAEQIAAVIEALGKSAHALHSIRNKTGWDYDPKPLRADALAEIERLRNELGELSRQFLEP